MDSEDRTKVNPAWVEAPYRSDFLVGMPPARLGWSRRRRLRHYELFWRKLKRNWMPARFQATEMLAVMPDGERWMVPIIHVRKRVEAATLCFNERTRELGWTT